MGRWTLKCRDERATSHIKRGATELKGLEATSGKGRFMEASNSR